MRSGVDQREGTTSGRPFEYYLRTGVRLVPEVGASGISVKFNQNHDPASRSHAERQESLGSYRSAL